MMDNKIIIAQLVKMPMVPGLTMDKIYCLKIYDGMTPRGFKSIIVEFLNDNVPNAYIGSWDWVKYHFRF